jgi:hypothetical protein
MVKMHRLGHGSGRTRAPSLMTGLHAWRARTATFGTMTTCSRATEPGNYRSAGYSCTVPRGVEPPRPSVCNWPLCHITHCGNSDGCPVTAELQICLGRSQSGCSAASSGGGRTCGGSTHFRGSNNSWFRTIQFQHRMLDFTSCVTP